MMTSAHTPHPYEAHAANAASQSTKQICGKSLQSHPAPTHGQSNGAKMNGLVVELNKASTQQLSSNEAL